MGPLSPRAAAAGAHDLHARDGPQPHQSLLRQLELVGRQLPDDQRLLEADERDPPLDHQRAPADLEIDEGVLDPGQVALELAVVEHAADDRDAEVVGRLTPADDRHRQLHREIHVEPAGDAVEKTEVEVETAALGGGPRGRRVARRQALLDHLDHVVDGHPHLGDAELRHDQRASARPQALRQLDAIDLDADAAGGDGGAGQVSGGRADQGLASGPVDAGSLERTARDPHQPAGERGL
jgi:hypothetical protein